MKKFKTYVNEAAYKNNVGAIEMFNFFKVANKKEIDEMEKIAKEEDWDAFKKLVKKVLKVNLI